MHSNWFIDLSFITGALHRRVTSVSFSLPSFVAAPPAPVAAFAAGNFLVLFAPNYPRRQRSVGTAWFHWPRLQRGKWARPFAKCTFSSACGGWQSVPAMLMVSHEFSMLVSFDKILPNEIPLSADHVTVWCMASAEFSLAAYGASGRNRLIHLTGLLKWDPNNYLKACICRQQKLTAVAFNADIVQIVDFLKFDKSAW